MDTSDQADPILYDYVKMRFRVDPSAKAGEYPSITWKDQKRQWLVLCSHVMPHQCYLTYCQQENIWLTSKKTLPKIMLVNFGFHRTADTKSKVNNLELCFSSFSILLEFDSVSKLQTWFESLDKIRARMYCDLVRCPEQPQNEREYVIELANDGVKFYNPRSRGGLKLEFKWTIAIVKRAKYHTNIGKVEIEVGRRAPSGPGHYFFIGHNIRKFYIHMKSLIEQARKTVTILKQQKELGAKTRSSTMPVSSSSTTIDSFDNDEMASITDIPPPLPTREYEDEEIIYQSVDKEDPPFLSSSSLSFQRRPSEPAPPPLPPRVEMKPTRSLSNASRGQESFEFPTIDNSPNPYQIQPYNVMQQRSNTNPFQTTEAPRIYQPLESMTFNLPAGYANVEGHQTMYSLASEGNLEEVYDLPALPPKPRRT